jgi:hypothetical protein
VKEVRGTSLTSISNCGIPEKERLLESSINHWMEQCEGLLIYLAPLSILIVTLLSSTKGWGFRRDYTR